MILEPTWASCAPAFTLTCVFIQMQKKKYALMLIQQTQHTYTRAHAQMCARTHTDTRTHMQNRNKINTWPFLWLRPPLSANIIPSPPFLNIAPLSASLLSFPLSLPVSSVPGSFFVPTLALVFGHSPGHPNMLLLIPMARIRLLPQFEPNVKRA